MKYIACFFISMLSALLVSKYAEKLYLIDIPSERSSHLRPTPKGGGVGILCAFLIVSVGIQPISFWLPIFFLSIVSLKNDISDISPKVRLVVQFIVVLVVLLNSGIGTSGGLIIVPLILFCLCAFFVVATANIYNFMDGINGIASLMGIVSFFLLGLFLIAFEKEFAVLCFGLAFSCLGFLPFNVPRAKIFMGDVGSILLGFVFATVVVLTTRSPLEFLIMSSFLLLFYLDELISIVNRIKQGKSLLVAHRGHLYQILVNEGGCVHWKVASGYALAQLLIGSISICLQPFGILIVVLNLLIFSVVFCFFDSFIKRRYCID